MGFIRRLACMVTWISSVSYFALGQGPERTTGNYTIRCTANAAGEITGSEFIYDGTIPEDSAYVRIILTNAAGEEKAQCVASSKANAYYKGGPIYPTKAPDSIILSSRYYCWRYTDCLMRNRIMGTTTAIPRYYLDYGDKYATRFKTEVRPKLSPEGRLWLDKTTLLFQLTTEALLLENREAELNDSEFRKQLFDLHPKVYEATGFFDLSFRDKWIIARHIDLKDLVSREGRAQIRQIARDYIPYLQQQLLNRFVN